MPTTAQVFTGMTSTFTDDWTLDQHHISTATFWTLHLRAARGVSQLAAQVMATGCEALTGEWIGGDNFYEWCEPLPEDGIPALHVHFRADDSEQAVRIARGICERISITQAWQVCLSTAGDWSEQLEVWDR